MVQPSLNEAIVAEAMSWVGTPYHHHAMLKGRGVDCAMLLVAVYSAVGAVPPFDPREETPYPPDWYHHKTYELFLSYVERFATKVPEGESPALADVAMYQWGHCISHGGIVVDVQNGIMVHADRLAGRVERCETRRWSDRFRGYWRLKA